MSYLQLVRLTWHLLSDGGFYVFVGGLAVLVTAFLPTPIRPDIAPGTLAGIGVGLVALGFAMGLLAVWLERSAVGELEREHAAQGEVDSPSPSIADGVWKEWTCFDGFRELWHGPVPVVPLVDHVQVHEVTLDEFQAAGRIKPERELAVPPPGDLDQQGARLAGCHGPRTLEGIAWPVCCERLAVLVLAGEVGPTFPIEQETYRFHLIGTSDTSLLLSTGTARLQTMLEAGPDQPVSRERVVGFHCRACGRIYADLLPVRLR